MADDAVMVRGWTEPHVTALDAIAKAAKPVLDSFINPEAPGGGYECRPCGARSGTRRGLLSEHRVGCLVADLEFAFDDLAGVLLAEAFDEPGGVFP